MAHTEIYTIKGQKYKYEVANYRVGKKVRHKKRYLGPVKPIYTTKKRGEANGFQKKGSASSSAFEL